MKFAGPLLLATLLLPPAAAWAQDVATADSKPYANIVARNVFGLLPIPPVDNSPPSPPVESPPKITPTGIMDIFGRLQALFKAANKPKPGQPAKESSYVLSEGERQDDIEVVKINRDDGIITFNNHGTMQELALITSNPTAASPAGANPGATATGYPMGGIPRPGPMSAAERDALARGRPMGRIGRSVDTPNQNNNNLGNPGFNPGQSPNSPQSGNIEDQVMNTAKQMAQIELNRIETQDAVDKGLLPPLPPTMLTPPDATGYGGHPLIVPNENVPQPGQ